MKESASEKTTATTTSATQATQEPFFGKQGGGGFFEGGQQNKESKELISAENSPIFSWLERNKFKISSLPISDDVVVGLIRRDIKTPYTDEYIKGQIKWWREASINAENRSSKKEHFYFIHGTGSTPKVWRKYDGKIIQIISANFGDEKKEDEIHAEKWNGANNSTLREEAIRKLVKKVYLAHMNNPEEPITMVGHSHGGNIALEVVNKLSKALPEHCINLITLNTPVRSDYQPKYDDNVKHFNFYISNDDIQQKEGGFNVTGKVYNPGSGTAFSIPALPPKGHIERTLLLLATNTLLKNFGDIFNIKIQVDESLLPNLGGESGTAGYEFIGAVNIMVTSPVAEGKEGLINKPLRHRLWHKKNLDALKKAMAELNGSY